ncbi:hypothetical protein BLNAU_3063 [Blattamonas nauphoetae]|uniref:Uncharacterized protein n=1 Tax=Blattamonas nauphoetae TaxID=2049346 RepID=A0ABQ9YE15_9EUKA|nr:hypothetical protein BLNAU_3063 [Blattamonas nauphoetae]
MSLDPSVFQKNSEADTPHMSVSLPTIDSEREPFLHFPLNTELSSQDESMIYNSLVALVKAEYPFDDALQDKAVLFLQYLEPELNYEDLHATIVTCLVPSSDKPCSSFVESISTLLSSPHTKVVEATLFLLSTTILDSSTEIKYQLVVSDVVTNVLATVRPHTLPVSGNEEMFKDLIRIVRFGTILTYPSHLENLGITTAAATYKLREMIFQKVVLPSSRLVGSLISNRHLLSIDLLSNVLYLLTQLLRIAPFHRPTLEYVLGSQIAMAIPSCLSSIENSTHIYHAISLLRISFEGWKEHDSELAQSAKRMIQALISEGFENTLEQILKRDKNEHFGELLKETNGKSICKPSGQWDDSLLFSIESGIAALHARTAAVHSRLPFEEKSTIYCSLVFLVKTKFAFNNALQAKAAQFLKSLEPERGEEEEAETLVTDLVPSSSESPIVAAAFSFLNETMSSSPTEIRCDLVQYDLSLKGWKKQGPEAAQYGHRMLRALFSEGFEDTLEQMMKIAQDEYHNNITDHHCHLLSKLLGSNVKRW